MSVDATPHKAPRLQNMAFVNERLSVHEQRASVHLTSGVHLNCTLDYWLRT